MSTMLGGEISQLEALETKLRGTAQEILEIDQETRGTSTTVVAEMRSAFGVAITGIDGAMSRLQTSVEGARSQMESTTWTGGNRTAFEHGYADFNSAMLSFEGAVRQAFDAFNAQMDAVATTIDDFQLQVSASLQQANLSAFSMGDAVAAQNRNLDQAMNGSLSFG